MIKLFKATAIASIATVTTILVGVVRAKFTALTLGPAGVGIFSQAFNFQQLIITVSSLSMGLGIAKYVAEYHAKNDGTSVEGTIICAFAMQSIVSLVIIISVALFSGMFSWMLFTTGEYGGLLLVVAVGTVFFVMASTIEAVMFGFGNYKAFAKGRSFSSVLALIPLFIFVSLMNIRGAFIYLAASGLVTFLVYGYLFYAHVPKEVIAGIFAKGRLQALKADVVRLGKNLLAYGGVSFITGILGLVNVVLLRSLLIRHFGADANGFYQVVFSLSAYYIAFFTNGLWSYFFAKISSVSDMKSYNDEMNAAIRFCVFGMVPSIVGLFLLKDAVIHLIFSREFLDAKALFPGQLMGDLFFMIFYIMGTSLLARARLKIYLLFNFLYTVSFVGFFFLCMPFAGTSSIVISYCVTNIILVSAITYYHIKRVGLAISAGNMRLFASGASVVAATVWVGPDTMPWFAMKSMLLIVWLAVLSTRSEKMRIAGLVTSRLQSAFGEKHA